MKHTLAEEPRHPSGKKLYEFGDIVIDNCGPHGDALLKTEGVAKVCSVSSICNNCIAQSMAARVIELLKEDGYEVPVLNGNREHTQKQVAELLGISQSYISRLEKKIISQLKKTLETQ